MGLAITSPRRALSIASERRHAGRSGSDLLAAIAIMLVATELRWMVQAGWLAVSLDAGLGARALVHVLAGTLAIDLGLLVVAAGAIAFGGGNLRELGRAFDLACVAVLPLVIVDLAAGVASSIAQAAPPDAARWIILAISYGWTAWLVWIAISVNRGGRAAELRVSHAGWGVIVLALFGIVVQARWIAANLDDIRPLQPGGQAPAIALPRVGPGGKLGERVSVTPGRVTVVDFWATWCGPCLRAMPHLDRFARSHPNVDVLTINLDDPTEARAIFDKAQYGLTILEDDGKVSEHFGVQAIPDTIIIDGRGALVAANANDLEAEIAGVRR
ncbi:MAG TPA: TlpA disulfide reductase family protein [Kofleriaceae bacterium]|nr:TlpA disulfide reductase family protein [Kofleriaceae bacterium]